MRWVWDMEKGEDAPVFEDQAQAQQILGLLMRHMNDIRRDTAASTRVARDAADVPVQGTLMAAKADYLMTGDDDLLALSGRYSIVTPAEFWRKHGS